MGIVADRLRIFYKGIDNNWILLLDDKSLRRLLQTHTDNEQVLNLKLGGLLSVTHAHHVDSISPGFNY
jgi:hypothetical protein